jgi:O-6-methylguanine DNA methyltransferase
LSIGLIIPLTSIVLEQRDISIIATGQPKATRAVARTCATNPVAIVIPCHRVVPKTGGVGGYRWGSERKKKLLAMENKDG